MTPAQLEAAARDAAERVERTTGTPAWLARGPILWALQDAQAEARYQAAAGFMRGYWRALGGLLVLALAWWAWP